MSRDWLYKDNTLRAIFACSAWSLYFAVELKESFSLEVVELCADGAVRHVLLLVWCSVKLRNKSHEYYAWHFL